jgi:prolyl-tRNA editing enzyme YbaK/EbsC (Cys-tRNA(Pro) deacylase)
LADQPKKVGSRERVRTFLDTHGLADEIVEFEQSTKTAAEAADAMGCVSPFALPDALPVLFDDSLMRFEVVYPAAGTPSSMVHMRCTDLLGMSKGRVARISL